MTSGKCIHCGNQTMIPTGCIRCGFPASGEVAAAIGYTNPAISASIHLRDIRRKKRNERSQAALDRNQEIEQDSTRDNNQKALYVIIAVFFGLYFMSRAAGLI